MVASEIIENAIAMPLTSPSYPRGPYRFTNREYLMVSYRADHAALELAVLNDPGFLLKIMPHVDGTPRICEIVRFTPS